MIWFNKLYFDVTESFSQRPKTDDYILIIRQEKRANTVSLFTLHNRTLSVLDKPFFGCFNTSILSYCFLIKLCYFILFLYH